MSTPSSVWSHHARAWARLGPPLRPSPEDTDAVRRVVAEWPWAGATGALRAMVLGVTPELGTLGWPPRTKLVAVDRSAAMIEHVWPKAGLPQASTTLVADWLSLPLDDGAIDLAAGDGCTTMFSHPEGVHAFADELHRVLAPRGRLVLRCFVRPPLTETPEAVAKDLWDGRIQGFHAFKWRLVTSLQTSLSQGVRLAEVWSAWARICPDPSVLSRRLGWAPDVVSTLDAYRELDAVYTFPTLDELRALLEPRFVELATRVATYELAERCPTLVLGKRSAVSAETT